MRNNFLLTDIQACFTALMKTFAETVVELRQWQITTAFSGNCFAGRVLPVIVIGLPVVQKSNSFQGSKAGYDLELEIGLWMSRSAGGAHELSIAESAVLACITDKSSLYSTEFDLTLNGEICRGQTLSTQGIRLNRVAGPEREQHSREDEFKSRFKVNISVS